MINSSKASKDRMVRAMAGFLIIAMLLVQKLFNFDLSVFILGVGLNLLQFGFTGYCPVASYFEKIGWLQNN